MLGYKLSKSAQQDLIQIALYGDVRFGIIQSDSYRDQLKKRFSLIAESPMMYPAVDHIRTGYRRSVCEAHSIYYRINKNHVEIIRILSRQDTNDSLR